MAKQEVAFTKGFFISADGQVSADLGSGILTYEEVRQPKEFPVADSFLGRSVGMRPDGSVDISLDFKPDRLDEQQVGGSHYKDRELTPWQIIDADFTKEGACGFYRGNALKYLLRNKGEDRLEDLKKAQHYITKLIEALS